MDIRITIFWTRTEDKQEYCRCVNYDMTFPIIDKGTTLDLLTQLVLDTPDLFFLKTCTMTRKRKRDIYHLLLFNTNKCDNLTIEQVVELFRESVRLWEQ